MQDIPGAVVVAKVCSVVYGAIGVGASDGNVTRPGRISKGVAHDCEVLHNGGSCIVGAKYTQVQQQMQTSASGHLLLRDAQTHHDPLLHTLLTKRDQAIVSLISCSSHTHSLAEYDKSCT